MSKDSQTSDVGRHVFVFNPKDNGGESIMLVTDYFDNGDDERFLYTNQTLTLQSYGNSASIQMEGCFTPETLRKLANELESQHIKMETKCRQQKNQAGASR